LRIATGVAVELPEKCELHWFAVAATPTMVGAIVAFARQIHIDGVISIAVGLDSRLPAHLGQDTGGVVSACGPRGIDDVTRVRGIRTYLAVGPRVFIGGLGVIRGVVE